MCKILSWKFEDVESYLESTVATFVVQFQGVGLETEQLPDVTVPLKSTYWNKLSMMLLNS